MMSSRYYSVSTLPFNEDRIVIKKTLYLLHCIKVVEIIFCKSFKLLQLLET